VLAVLVERRGADEAQLAPGEHRLQHVAGVHGPLGGSGTDHRVELVDEGDDLALGVGDLLEDGLQALLELTAVLRPGDHRPQVQSDDALVLEALGHVAVGDTARQALDDGGLADAGLADEHRVVLGTAGEHLDDAADLLVTTDDRIDLPVPGRLGEVAAVLLERLELLLGVLARDAVAAPHVAQGRQELLPIDAEAVGHGQQQVLGREIVVTELLAGGVGDVEHLGELPGGAGLATAVGLGQALDGLVGAVAHHEGRQAELLQHR
jgi:hypothetical protein